MANVADLLDAAGRPEVRRIVVTAELADVPMVWLAAGQVLEGAKSALIRFAPGQDGLQLSADNTVENLQIAEQTRSVGRCSTTPRWSRWGGFICDSCASRARCDCWRVSMCGTAMSRQRRSTSSPRCAPIRQQAEGLRGGGGTWRLHAVDPAVGSFCGRLQRR